MQTAVFMSVLLTIEKRLEKVKHEEMLKVLRSPYTN